MSIVFGIVLGILFIMLVIVTIIGRRINYYYDANMVILGIVSERANKIINETDFSDPDVDKNCWKNPYTEWEIYREINDKTWWWDWRKWTPEQFYRGFVTQEEVDQYLKEHEAVK